ncbi:hypothetical protein TNCV_5025451 [Trichonephila clavipes]|nr:hypothetical protein TNCV_5025451 [Trichonephila clavipes]
MKVARFNETFPQAELRRLEQAERDAAHRAAETPERSQARRGRSPNIMPDSTTQVKFRSLESNRKQIYQHFPSRNPQKKAKTEFRPFFHRKGKPEVVEGEGHGAHV